jgi:hypothetical protein
LLAIIARSTQRDRGQRKEKVEECRRKGLGGMSLAASGRNAKLCGSDGKFAPTNIWKRGNGFGDGTILTHYC